MSDRGSVGVGEFYALVKRMREVQRRYFKDRNPADVGVSKALEREVDRAIAEHEAPPGLFDREVRACRDCGCTDLDCRDCIERTGGPCHWVEEDLCSACAQGVRS